MLRLIRSVGGPRTGVIRLDTHEMFLRETAKEITQKAGRSVRRRAVASVGYDSAGYRRSLRSPR